MSPRTRITTLNLGSQSIELADFGIRPDGELILHGYRSREILADPTVETGRHEQVISALGEMATELQIKRGNINYTVAEESTFTRFVRLPPIEDEKIERIIAFEAQQNVPFPIDQVVWDYQLIGGAGEPVQVIAPDGSAKLIRIDSGGLAGMKIDSEIRRLITEEALHAFDLMRGPLLRVVLLRAAPQHLGEVRHRARGGHR